MRFQSTVGFGKIWKTELRDSLCIYCSQHMERRDTADESGDEEQNFSGSGLERCRNSTLSTNLY